MITISKSSYIRGLQCTKSFYLNFFHKQIDIARDDQDKKIFEIGHDVGKYAQQLFPGGVDCGYELTSDRTKSVELTKQAIQDGKEIIYEAAFENDGLLCFADILVKDGNEWMIYEVKSSTSVKDYHINDASFQYYVISKNIPVKDAIVVCLNNQYVRQSEIDIKQLFVMQSVLDQVIKLQGDIKLKTNEFKKFWKIFYHAFIQKDFNTISKHTLFPIEDNSSEIKSHSNNDEFRNFMDKLINKTKEYIEINGVNGNLNLPQRFTDKDSVFPKDYFWNVSSPALIIRKINGSFKLYKLVSAE